MEVRLKMSDFQKNITDPLFELEIQMKQVWSQYINYLEKNGFDDTATALKSKYMRIYQNYKNNKNWRTIVNNN